MDTELQNDQGAVRVGILLVFADESARNDHYGALVRAGREDVLKTSTPEEALEFLETPGFLKTRIILMEWKHSGEVTSPVFAQRIKNDKRFWDLDFVIFSGDLSDPERFLLAELDVRHVLPMDASPEQVVVKVQEVRAEQDRTDGIKPLLRELAKALQEHDSQAVERLWTLPALAHEVRTNPQFIQYYGEVLIVQKEYGKAVSLLKGFLKEPSRMKIETLRALSTLGKALCIAGQYQEAVVIFDRLSDKSPKNLSHKTSLGDALLGIDDAKGAKAKYEEVLSVDPNNPTAMVGMGKAFMAEGDYNSAKEFFGKVKGPIESYSLASFFNNKAVCLVKTGRTEEAIALYQHALPFLDKYKGRVYFNLGMAFYRLGKIAQARSCFEEARRSKDAMFLANKTVMRKASDRDRDEDLGMSQRLVALPH